MCVRSGCLRGVRLLEIEPDPRRPAQVVLWIEIAGMTDSVLLIFISFTPFNGRCFGSSSRLREALLIQTF